MITQQDLKLICRMQKGWSAKTIRVKKAGGQTNKNWIVNCKGKLFFVRLPWERADIIDRTIEGKNIMALSRNKKLKGVLPIYYLYIQKKKNILHPESSEVFELPDGAMMMEYIEGREINGELLADVKVQKALLQSLHTFHTSGVRFVNRYDVFQHEVAKYRIAAKKHAVNQILDANALSKIEEIERKAKGKLSIAKKGISTHNDLIFENLLLAKNNRVYLLDFEYGGFNIREGLYYDIGILLGGNLFCKQPITTELFEELLLQAGHIYGRELDREKIYYGALTNVLVMFWWGLVRYFDVKTKKEKEYFRNYVLKRHQGIAELYQVIIK